MITPIFVMVSTPMIKSYTGLFISTGTSTMSGLIVNNFDSENDGNFISKRPTFVVLKVPLDVFHFWGEKRSFWGMRSLLLGCTNSRSPLDPLSSKTRQTLLAVCTPFLIKFGTATTVLHVPVPLTTFFCLVDKVLSTNLIGLIFLLEIVVASESQINVSSLQFTELSL